MLAVPGAHPRSRGENQRARSFFTARRGSSPLTRGKRGRLRLGSGVGRLIPAHAGKTAPGPTSPTSRRAHPRSRGENVSPTEVSSTWPGSSPLTRGKLALIVRVGHEDGLIPAHAGKTRRSRPVTRPTRAHPRSRGENLSGAVDFERVQGSSPLTRGKPLNNFGQRLHVGLIPAHAGKTTSYAGNLTVFRAHPRSRGENQVAVLAIRRAAGSSPLTRGKHGRSRLLRARGGLIPAHAGKTHGRSR